MLDKKEIHQKALEKKILNAKIFEFHKDLKKYETFNVDELNNKSKNKELI